MEHITDQDKTRCFSVLVMNSAGVLSRIAGLFARRGYNIDALTVGPTEDDKVSRITITVNDDDDLIEQIKKQLYKLVDVIKVVELEKGKSIRRELVYIKVKADNQTRANIVEICNLFRAKIVDVAPNSLVLEIVGPRSKVDAFFEMISPFGIIEFVRSGETGLQRGKDAIRIAENNF